MGKTILVVEYELKRRLMLEERLSKQGFRVWLAENSHEALLMALEMPPDLILLDLMMPDWAGYQFLRCYRRKRNTPIITMTEKMKESEAVMAFRLGADDVVSKPLRVHELAARIEAVLRRVNFRVIDRLEVDDVVLDRVSHTVTVGGMAVNLTSTELHLLSILMSQAGRAVPHQTLFKHLIKAGYTGAESSIKVHIRHLRKKIEPDTSYPKYIKSVFGVGYRFSHLY